MSLKEEEELRKISYEQASKIRKAITKRVGSRRQTFPKMGYWIVLNPLTDYPVCYWCKTETALNNVQHNEREESLVYEAKYRLVDRPIPTIEDLTNMELLLKEDGEYTFDKNKIKKFIFKSELKSIDK